MLIEFIFMPILSIITQQIRSLLSNVFIGALFFIAPNFSAFAASDSANQPNQRTVITGYSSFSIIEERNHDPSIFTQGFDYEDGLFYESSGLFGKSFVRSYKHLSPPSDDHSSDNNKGKKLTEPASQSATATKDKAQPEQIKQTYLSKKIFAEGLVKVGDLLHLLTWQSGKLLSMDAKSLNIINIRNYRGEGWGITHDGNDFVMSDGSEKLYFRDFKTFQVKKQITVRDDKRTYTKLNELEYANGFIWANVWLSTYILKINPLNGNVIDRFDLSEIVTKNSARPMHTVLNGIAYDKKHDAFWVTGKYWPKKYLIKF